MVSKTDPPSQGWRTVRVFISSTFRDMHAERDHLVRFVFPRLREELLQRRLHLVDVDLRWGVTSDQDVFDLCMDEIQRCHPRFICILGGRYGWVPPPKAVAADITEQILSDCSPAGAIASEERAALIALYNLDQSAGYYRLAEKPRTVADVKTYYTQGELAVTVFQRAGLSGVDLSITASEIHFGALDCLNEPAFRFFYFRKQSVTDSIPQPYAAYYRELKGSCAERQLNALKCRVKDPETKGKTSTEPGKVVEALLPWYEYPCRWDADLKRITDLKAFGDRVYKDLLKSVDSEYVAPPPEKLDEFAEENAAMEAFIEERTERYVVGSRRPIFDRLRHHAEGSGGNGYLCLIGESGSGKSALLSQFYRNLAAPHILSQSEIESPPSDIPHSWQNEFASTEPRSVALRTRSLVISHFVGASAGSTDVSRTLRRFCHELKAGAGLGGDIPEDFEKLRKAFPEFLARATQTHHVVIILDAINQLDSSFQSSAMHWLPNELPPNGRFIVSALPCEALESLHKRPQPPEEISLPALSGSDAEAITDGFLARYRKTLDSDQRAALLAKDDARKPLYLLAAIEELRTLGTHEEINARIQELPGQTKPLFIWILKRLEADPGFCDAIGHQIGPELVRKFVSYIGVSRHGLSYAELAKLLALGKPPADPPIPSDALGNVAALIRLLRPYVMRRGALLDFFHNQFREAVEEDRLTNDQERVTAHRVLADFFRDQADPGGYGTWGEKEPRSIREIVYHLIEGKMWGDLLGCLLDLNYLEARMLRADVVRSEGHSLRFDGVFELLDDYRATAAALKSPAAADFAETFSLRDCAASSIPQAERMESFAFQMFRELRDKERNESSHGSNMA